MKYVAEVVGERGLNLLVNNAGIPSGTFLVDDIDPARLRTVFEVNTFAPVLLTRVRRFLEFS